MFPVSSLSPFHLDLQALQIPLLILKSSGHLPNDVICVDRVQVQILIQDYKHQPKKEKPQTKLVHQGKTLQRRVDRRDFNVGLLIAETSFPAKMLETSMKLTLAEKGWQALLLQWILSFQFLLIWSSALTLFIVAILFV